MGTDGGHYTDSIEKRYNSMFLAVNPKWNFGVFQIGKIVC